ncbi:MAG: DNA primase [Lachnospiraceae bacterium]|nr:DNA primase [Lachnospiraceae bacterium]
MPRYSDEIIEEVREKNDILDVIGQYVHLERRGSTYFGLCPFHSEKTPSFSVTPSKGMYYCFGCHKGGNVFTFLMEKENMSFPEAVEELANRAGVDLPKREMSRDEKARQTRREQLLAVHKDAATYFYRLLHSPEGKIGLKYFQERKLTPEIMTKFGLGFSGTRSDGLYQYLKGQGYKDDLLKDSGLITYRDDRGPKDRFWNRVIFPIMDPRRHVIAFGGRVMGSPGEHTPKYLNSPETEIFNKRKTLYGMHIARGSRRREFILCEGYMDVISMHQGGFDNTVASLGTALTEENVAVLKNYRKPVLLSYDSDGAGVDAALKAIRLFRKAGIACRVINMRPYKDPDEFLKALGPEEYEKRIETAENAFLYEIRMLMRDYDLKDPQQKTDFQVAMADRVIETFPEEMERNNYIDVLCRDYQMPRESFLKLLAEEVTKGVRADPEPEEIGPAPLPVQRRQARLQSKDEGYQESERLLLSWMAEYPDVLDQVRDYLKPSDFTEGVHRDLAEDIYQGKNLEEGYNPAALVTHYELEDEQAEVARIFHTGENLLETPDDWAKALSETVFRLKERAIQEEEKRMDPRDPTKFNRIIENKNLLQKLKQTKFTAPAGRK